MTTTTAPKLKFVKVSGDVRLASYESAVDVNLGYGPVRGKFVIEAVPSDVYESRLDGYTVRWVPVGTQWRGRQVGSRTLRWGKGERLLADAKKAAQADLESWNREWASA